MSAACNINSKGRRQRMILGVPLLLVGTIAAFMDRSFLWPVVAFFGFLSVFQAQSGTCVAMAARGALERENGERELLADPEDVAFFRKQARGIYLRTFFATLAVMVAGRAWLWYRG